MSGGEGGNAGIERNGGKGKGGKLPVFHCDGVGVFIKIICMNSLAVDRPDRLKIDRALVSIQDLFVI